jgi:predicted site-specific integrase-resolvase
MCIRRHVMPSVKGYSLKQVAKKVGRSTATIVRWIDVGKVKITKKKNAQGHYIFTEADLEKLRSYNETIKQID